MNRPEDQVLVIFGASGDLTKRMLMPSLYELHVRQMLPERFVILGTSRKSMSDDEFRLSIRSMLQELKGDKGLNGEEVDRFLQKVYYQPFDPVEGADELGERVMFLMEENAIPMRVVYYLATPPNSQQAITKYIGRSCLFGVKERGGWHRIVGEKPFGTSLETAKELDQSLLQVFCEQEIYRIDHFLGKETVQNILVLRFANEIFESLWNRNYVDYVEIYALESLGIENRGKYYETTGALRDMVQNHLIQLVALTAMEPPAVFNADNFRNEVVKVYESLTPLNDVDLNEHIVRGQYTASGSKKGYREEKGVAPDSRTETYIAMKLGISNWRWSGVPFYIRTGKQMPTKVTEIVVHFRETPHQMFHCASGNCPRANKLILRLQPNEGIVLKIGMKVPGAGFEVRQVTMDFSYAQLGGVPSGDAYARLIDDCIQGDPTLFTRSDAVEASWKFFDPVLRYWKDNPDAPLYGYPAGTWGPLESEAMMHEHGADWTNPCKNLTNTDQYCEL